MTLNDETIPALLADIMARLNNERRLSHYMNKAGKVGIGGPASNFEAVILAALRAAAEVNA